MFNANRLLQVIMSSAAAAAAAAVASVPASTNLFVASYAGNVTTLSLSNSKGKYGLSKIATNSHCGPNPTWLTIDTEAKRLYCLDEGLNVKNGSLTLFDINKDGSLESVQRVVTPKGPVSGAFYNNHSDIALAHYDGSAISTWTLPKGNAGKLTNVQDLFYTLSKPGPNPDRQDAPHEHEAIVDPTGQYVLVPDLGADLVRVFGFEKNGTFITKQPLSVVPGSGPRHGAFFLPDGKPGGTTFLYIITELGNTVTSYSVTYLPNYGGLSFKEVYTSNVYGTQKMPSGNAAAEVAVSPDSRFLVISNRNNTSFELPNPDPKNSTKIPSDSISTFALNKDGTLTFTQLAPCGGPYPRQFAMNAAGDLVAVGLQMSHEVTVLKRDVRTGKIGDVVASVPVKGQVTCVRWDEKIFDGTYANI